MRYISTTHHRNHRNHIIFCTLLKTARSPEAKLRIESVLSRWDVSNRAKATFLH